MILCFRVHLTHIRSNASSDVPDTAAMNCSMASSTTHLPILMANLIAKMILSLATLCSVIPICLTLGSLGSMKDQYEAHPLVTLYPYL